MKTKNSLNQNQRESKSSELHPVEALEISIKILKKSGNGSLGYVIGLLNMKLDMHKKLFRKGFTL